MSSVNIFVEKRKAPYFEDYIRFLVFHLEKSYDFRTDVFIWFDKQNWRGERLEDGYYDLVEMSDEEFQSMVENEREGSFCNIFVQSPILRVPNPDNGAIYNADVEAFEDLKLPNSFVLNMEQASRKIIQSMIKRLQIGGYGILDYSEANASFYEGAHVIPYIYFPGDIEGPYEKFFDICMLPSFSRRRVMLVNDLTKNRGISVSTFGGWRGERDETVNQHKVMLNCHFTEEYKIMEEIRVNRVILNKTIVVAEESLMPETLVLGDRMLIVPYSEMASKTTEVLENYEETLEKLYKDFDIEYVVEKQKEFFDKFIKSI